MAAALALMASGKLHRYGELGGQPSEVSALEAEFAAELGDKYCVALNSCGSAMFVALKAAGVKPGDAVLSNCFTLAPVPGAIAHAGARPLLVDVTDDCTIDLADIERKAQASGAKTLLLSHMRGHIADMPALMAVCRRHGVQVIEDCAHTMGAGWAGRATGTWNQRHGWMAAALQAEPHLRLPQRPADEQFVASSIQFSLVGLRRDQIEYAVAACAERAVHIKWFGADEPVGFTSVWRHWRHFGDAQALPRAERVLGGLCDMRLPLTLTQADCVAIGAVICSALSAVGP